MELLRLKTRISFHARRSAGDGNAQTVRIGFNLPASLGAFYLDHDGKFILTVAVERA